MSVNPTERSDADATGTPASGFTAVLRLREFRLLWLADIQSLLGDQVARVALSVLVFDSTHSGLATAAVYALTYLPALLGGVLLGHLASCLLWALAGTFTGYQVQVVTEFVETIAPQVRGQGIAIASAGLLGAQGIGLLAGGLTSQFTAPTTAIAAAGATAVILGSALALIRHRHRPAVS